MNAKLTEQKKKFIRDAMRLQVMSIEEMARVLVVPIPMIVKFIEEEDAMWRPKPKRKKGECRGNVTVDLGNPWKPKIPKFLMEFLKLEVMDDLWGKYHCIYSLGPQEAWEMRNTQRQKFEETMRQEMANVGLTMEHSTIKAARKAYLAALKWTDAPADAGGKGK